MIELWISPTLNNSSKTFNAMVQKTIEEQIRKYGIGSSLCRDELNNAKPNDNDLIWIVSAGIFTTSNSNIDIYFRIKLLIIESLIKIKYGDIFELSVHNDNAVINIEKFYYLKEFFQRYCSKNYTTSRRS